MVPPEESLEIDIDPVEPIGIKGGSDEIHAVVATTPSRGLAALACAAVVLLGVIAWQFVGATDGERAASDAEERQAEAAEDAIDSAAADTVITDAGEQLEWVRVDADAALPLFPFSPDLTLVTTGSGAGIAMVDATSGDLSRFTAVSGGAWYQYDRALGTLVGRTADTFIVRSMRWIIGYPMNGDSPVRYGESDDVVLTEDLVVLISRPPEGAGATILSGFSPDGTALGNVLEPAFRQRTINPSGYQVGPDGSHVFTGVGFERQTDHAIVASGPNHVLEARCSGSLECSYHRVDLATWESTPVVVSTSFDWVGNGMSPDGEWLSSYAIEDGRLFYRFMELATGDYYELRRPSNIGDDPTAFRWDPTSRYVVLGTAGRLVVFDVDLGEFRLLDTEDLGLDSLGGGVLVVPTADLAP